MHVQGSRLGPLGRCSRASVHALTKNSVFILPSSPGSQQKSKKTSKKSNMARASDLQESLLALREPPPKPIIPACVIPKNVIAAMTAAGARIEDVEGEGLCVLHIDGVHSEAWNVYETWACSVGEVDPLVLAYFVPPLAIRRTGRCPANALGIDIQDEANSIIHHFAPLLNEDFGAGIPVLLATLAPLPAPAALTNVRHAGVAVTALVPAISCPGPSFPVINGLHVGQYICHVHYIWSSMLVTVPVFRT